MDKAFLSTEGPATINPNEKITVEKKAERRRRMKAESARRCRQESRKKLKKMQEEFQKNEKRIEELEWESHALQCILTSSPKTSAFSEKNKPPTTSNECQEEKKMLWARSVLWAKS